MPDSIDFKRKCIESGLPGLSVRQQCELLGLNRSSWYYRSAGESAENLQWMRRIDEQYLKTPCYGSRKMAKELGISRTRAQRLMRLMGLEAIYPKPHLSRNDTDHRIYPYLLRNVAILRPNQVWSSDITYVPMPHGWMYLTVVMDWYIYLHDHATPRALEAGLAGYFPFYNDERLHAALDYLTPAIVYAAA